MINKKTILAFLLVGTAVMLSGCWYVVVGAGAAGTVGYVMGDLQSVESADINTVYDATLKAVEQLELPVIQKSKDAISAKVKLRDSQDKKITIKLGATAERATKLSIRVGIFGNERKSRLIYDQIKKNLPK